MSTAIQVFTHKQEITINLPEQFASVVEMLPVVTRLFSDEKQTVISGKDLHSRVGGSYKPSRWIDSVIRDCRLVEGVDYWKARIDHSDPANFQEIARNYGKVPVYTYFSLKAARKITLRSRSDEAHIFYEFVDAVLDAVVPSLLKKLTLASKEANHQRALADRNEQAALKAVRAIDPRLNLSQFEMADQYKVSRDHAREEASRHREAALCFWEYSSKARRNIAAGKHAEALQDLGYLDSLYGNYSDMIRDEPPWLS